VTYYIFVPNYVIVRVSLMNSQTKTTVFQGLKITISS